VIRNCLTVLVLVTLGGCAFTPQKAALAPVVSVATSSEGKGVVVAVRVVDERPSKSLGHRGGGYGAAAEITSTEDVAMVVQKQVVEGLKKKGFEIVDYDDAKDPRLTVEVRLLEYSTSMGFWTGGVAIQGAIKAVASRGGKTYDHMYRSEKKERVVIVPNAKTNEGWINSALGDVLSQMFDDAVLVKFLTG
jgi:uncharacterized lipoprotein YajG